MLRALRRIKRQHKANIRDKKKMVCLKRRMKWKRAIQITKKEYPKLPKSRQERIAGKIVFDSILSRDKKRLAYLKHYIKTHRKFPRSRYHQHDIELIRKYMEAHRTRAKKKKFFWNKLVFLF